MNDFRKTMQFLYYLKLQKDLVLLGEVEDPRKKLWKSIENKREKEGNSVAFQYVEELRIEYEKYKEQPLEHNFNNFARQIIEAKNKNQERE